MTKGKVRKILTIFPSKVKIHISHMKSRDLWKVKHRDGKITLHFSVNFFAHSISSDSF